MDCQCPYVSSENQKEYGWHIHQQNCHEEDLILRSKGRELVEEQGDLRWISLVFIESFYPTVSRPLQNIPIFVSIIRYIRVFARCSDSVSEAGEPVG